ncbi:hypothetical protein FRC19_003028 [Serendipita sp. 401]|nr:hypothetical protein FRC19_003028 [Serendipita sp. 401]
MPIRDEAKQGYASPRTSFSPSHSRSSSSGGIFAYAPGASTPFPIAANGKYEYPVNDGRQPMSPSRPSPKDTQQFAQSLHRALRNLKQPFAFKTKLRTPPSLIAKCKEGSAARYSGYSSSNISSMSSASSESSNSSGFIDLRHWESSERPLKTTKSCTTFATNRSS